MIDFYNKQLQIESYIQEKFNGYLKEKELSVPDRYTSETIDFDNGIFCLDGN